MRNNPYDIPANPKVTIREILVWISRRGEVRAEDVMGEFEITGVDARVRLLKLHRWGYLVRRKSEEPPRVYLYSASKFGRKTAKRWGK